MSYRALILAKARYRNCAEDRSRSSAAPAARRLTPRRRSRLMYWVSNPVWLGGTLAITTVATVQGFYLVSRRTLTSDD